MADATVDTSITANAGRNMLTNVGAAVGVMNGINQNKLFMGRQAAGAALQQSIDPDTGQVDFQQLNRLISQNPQIAPYAQEALQAGLVSRGQDLSNVTGQTNLQGLYASNLRKVVSAVPPGPNQQAQILSGIARGAASGLYPSDFAASFVGGGQLDDGTTLADLAKQSAIAEGSPSAQSAQFGDVSNIDTGAQVQPTAINRAAGTATPLGKPIAKTLTPGEKASRVPVIQNGVPETVPLSTLATNTGAPKPSSLAGPNGEVQAALTPSEQAAGSTTGQGYGGMAVQLTQRAAKVRDNKAILGNMEGLIGEMDTAQLGPQSKFWKGIGQLAAEYGVPVPGAPPTNKTQAQEEFGKLAFQLAQSQFQALGGTGTDSKLDSTMHTSPSELLTRYGNTGIIHLLKGNEDAIQAQNDAWQKWQAAGHGPETYGQFQAQWNKIYDPRIFQAQYQSPAERQAALKGMTAEEQTQFKAAYKRAHSLGWVQ